MELRIVAQRLKNGARLPGYSTAGAAGLDLYACLEQSMVIQPGATTLVSTGVAVAIPAGYVGLIRDRSSLAIRGLLAVAGVIDSDYRGEILVALHCVGAEPMALQPGDRIAQMLVMPCPQVKMVEVEALPDSERGAGGFGSTGR